MLLAHQERRGVAGSIGLKGDHGVAGSPGDKGERGVAGLKGCGRSHWTEGGSWCCWLTRRERIEGCGGSHFSEEVWQVPFD